jgi:hypothetical protein
VDDDDNAEKEGSTRQNENMAAFFLVPNMYTSAWLMKSPTVMPMVTAIIALPMSIPLPDAVIAPPSACDRPDLKERKSQFPARNPPKKNAITYRDQEKYARHHNSERSPPKRTGIDIAQKAYCERAYRRHDIRPVENEMVRGLVRYIGNTRDDDHHDDVKLTPGLQVGQREERREEGNRDELRPERERPQVPRETRQTIATFVHVFERRFRTIDESERAMGRQLRAYQGFVVGEKVASIHDSSSQRSTDRGEAVSSIDVE